MQSYKFYLVFTSAAKYAPSLLRTCLCLALYASFVITWIQFIIMDLLLKNFRSFGEEIINRSPLQNLISRALFPLYCAYTPVRLYGVHVHTGVYCRCTWRFSQSKIHAAGISSLCVMFNLSCVAVHITVGTVYMCIYQLRTRGAFTAHAHCPELTPTKRNSVSNPETVYFLK